MHSRHPQAGLAVLFLFCLALMSFAAVALGLALAAVVNAGGAP